MIAETYKDMGNNYMPTKDDVKSYMKMVDKDGDGKVTLEEFEHIIIVSMENSGLKVFEWYFIWRW